MLHEGRLQMIKINSEETRQYTVIHGRHGAEQKVSRNADK